MKRSMLLPFLLATATFLGACGNDGTTTPSAPDAAADSIARGPHNGRLLIDGPFAVELAIYETGVPPEFRAWITSDGAPIAPQDVELQVRLTRLDASDTITFRPQGDFLVSEQTIHEPHSFSVAVEADHGGRSHRWQYDSFEGRTRIAPDMAAALGLETAIAGPARLAETITVYGAIVPAADRVREVSARFDGAVRAVDVALGATVRAGQSLATIDSNESLRPYTINAPIGGIVTERNANPGEQTAGRRLFTIVDPSVVWAELAVFLGDRPRVTVGMPATIRATLGDATGDGAIEQLSVSASGNQAVAARVPLDNATGQWALGTFVTATITVGETEVPIAVRRVGLQSFRDFTVVYAQVGDQYEVRMLELGRETAELVEVLGGLRPGTRYVTEGSYVLKADVEKSGASHDH